MNHAPGVHVKRGNGMNTIRSGLHLIRIGCAAGTYIAIFAVILAGPLASAYGSGRCYIINTKPFSLAVIDTASWKSEKTIPIEDGASYALLGPDERYVYILHYGLITLTGKQERRNGSVTVIDPETGEQVSQVELGWKPRLMNLSDNRKYVVCFRPGQWKNKEEWWPERPAWITAIDAATRKKAVSWSTERPGKQIVFNRDLSRIAVVDRARVTPEPVSGPALYLYDVGKEEPVAVIELERETESMELSADERWLYILNPGNPVRRAKKYLDAQVLVVDLENKSAGRIPSGGDSRSRASEGRNQRQRLCAFAAVATRERREVVRIPRGAA